MSEMRELLSILFKGKTLSEKQMSSAFELIMDASQVSDAQIGAFLYALSCHTPTSEELRGGAKALRKHMIKVPAKEQFSQQVIIDTCGTGGSGYNTFNTSTVVALLLASCGVKVAKHGNRATTSKCGSADLLNALEVNPNQSPEQALAGLDQTNFCFLFAPNHHPATKRVAGIRKDLGFRTIFNFLGPLVNPVEVEYQILGISIPALVRPMAEALSSLGVKHALLVCGFEGLDEISIAGKTKITEIKDALITEYNIEPEDFGLSSISLSQVEGAEPAKAAIMVREILGGKKDPRSNLIILNAGAALYVADQAISIGEGVDMARETLFSGQVLNKLEEIIAYYHV
ncbi:MAG: anthranilate phosphoribosyltransferase [Deltaproteobacteria bacterium]|nr:anthranilate phosphoribosyltransferase [Deltaproteobacteria bacterium]